MSVLTANELRELNIVQYIQLISFTVLLHEYCLTFKLEVSRFWSAQPENATWPVFLFFFNRYFVLLGDVPIMFKTFWLSTSPSKPMVCRAFAYYHLSYIVGVQIVVSVILIVRTYALYDRSRWVLGLIFAVGLASMAVVCWSILSEHPHSFNSVEYTVAFGCPWALSRLEGLRHIKSWGALLAFDTLIFTLTIYKSFKLVRRVGNRPNLLTLMLRDGSVYFGVMVVCTTANILTYAFGGVFTKGVITPFVNNISSAMITRLMLNLRDPRLLTAPRRSPVATAGLRNSENLTTFVELDSEIDERAHYSDHLEYLARRDHNR